MKIAENLTNHFLIAMPVLKDAIFTKGVVYIYEHTKDGAVGVVINKALQVTLGNLLQHLDIDIKEKSVENIPVLAGGPVGPERGFVIHDRVRSKKKGCDVMISASKELLREIAEGKGPDQFIVSLGYAGWEGGQLEKEINRNDWLIAPFKKSLIFDTPIEKRWVKAAESIGVDVNRLSDQVGHA